MLLAGLRPIFLAAAVCLLARAHYLVHVEKRGKRASRLMVWIMTLAAAAMWIGRL